MAGSAIAHIRNPLLNKIVRSRYMRYWPSVISTSSRSIKTQKRTWPISSHLDRTSLVNKGFIKWPKDYANALPIAVPMRAIPSGQDSRLGPINTQKKKKPQPISSQPSLLNNEYILTFQRLFLLVHNCITLTGRWVKGISGILTVPSRHRNATQHYYATQSGRLLRWAAMRLH